MGFGDGVELGAMGDVGVVSLAAFALKRARAMRRKLDRRTSPAISTTSGLAACPDRMEKP